MNEVDALEWILNYVLHLESTILFLERFFTTGGLSWLCGSAHYDAVIVV